MRQEDRAAGATAFVTLEPCSHEGKTPPCAPALIEAGIAEVVIAMSDPFPEVAGDGIGALESAGIRVRTGLMAEAAGELNQGFLSRVQRGRPHVRVKVGASLDGAIAMTSGESQWITGPDARVRRAKTACEVGCHPHRHRYGARGRSGFECPSRGSRYCRPATAARRPGLGSSHAALGRHA